MADLHRWKSLAKDLLRRGGSSRLMARIEDRLMGAILDATRLTNDGSYRRYRDDPMARGEHDPMAPAEAEPGAESTGLESTVPPSPPMGSGS